MKQLFTFLGPWRRGALVLCALLSGLGLFLKFGIPGYSFSSLVCFCLVALILFYAFFPLVGLKFPAVGLKFPAFAKAVTTAVTVCVVMGLLVVGITEGIIIAASFGSPKEPVAYVVVLGAKVNPDGPSVSLWDRICAAYTYLDTHPGVTAVLSGGRGTVAYVVVLGAKVNPDGPSVSLWDRICAAYTYLDTHPGVTAVLSGGRGTDEPITEAQCMYRELVELGIDPHRLILEEEATSTWENLHLGKFEFLPESH